ncbi:MAG: 3-hydroxyacyl-CoA dehydrogenase NAD-binding domain-containing protein [Trueperaceae bacterium]
MTIVELELRDGVAILWFDRPGKGPTLLDRSALGALPGVLERLENDQDIKALVVASQNPAGFIAGADIALFDEFSDREQAMALIGQVQALFARLARLPKPTIAAIHGPCAGGGLELALACDYRLASNAPATSLSLPEVQLGLLPALGGTQRLPRLVGLQAGLEMLLTGKKVYSGPARRLGLVDGTVHPEGLEAAALAAALAACLGAPPRLVTGRSVSKRHNGSQLGRLLQRTPAKALIFRRAAEQTLRQTRGNYPAPERILDTVRQTYGGPISVGLRVEAEAFADLLFTTQSQALRHLFFVRTRTRKNRFAGEGRTVEKSTVEQSTIEKDPAEKSPVEKRRVESIGVLGAGLMGAGIAQVSTSPGGYRVALKDQTFELAARGKAAVHRGLSERVGKGVTPFERDVAGERVMATDSYAPFARVDLTIEAVLEDLELKRQVLSEVEAVTGPDHIFASNTSSLPISEIAAGANRPSAVVGMHYFSPVPKMPLVEVVRGAETSTHALATAVEVGLRQGKNVIVVGDRPGFYVNRILAPYLNEALLAVREGAGIDEVDRAMEEGGFPVGPFRLLDNVGLEVAGKAVAVLAPLFAERGVSLDDFVATARTEGFAGRKEGFGFYLYGSAGKRNVNQRIYELLGSPQRLTLPRSELNERLLLALVNEAVHCLDEGIIRSREDGDAGAVFGIGFPPFLGGPFHYISSVGEAEVSQRLISLEERHGPRFRPAAGLLGA